MHLLLARDPLGIKPLYVTQRGDLVREWRLKARSSAHVERGLCGWVSAFVIAFVEGA